MESGWTRVNSCDLMDTVFSRVIWCDYGAIHGWLAQAKHIFNSLGVSSNHDDYLFLRRITYQVELSGTGNNTGGYLFLCPLADLKSNNPSYFRHPKCAAYWSLDPSGVERLRMEKAEQLGFPAFEFTMNARAHSWDESVYAGICQFHQARGFDPDSQDVALELGYPLFELSTHANCPFAHGG
ncbi:hypothetical protein FB451DRAFT_298728 [Mycena latifolia]|nr:hypothetical protein FB451DRAFT_298728 [Mycena latifolia]